MPVAGFRGKWAFLPLVAPVRPGESGAMTDALVLLGIIGGLGAIGFLVGRDLERTGRHGRDNWHRPGGYPTDPALPDRRSDGSGRLSAWTPSSAEPVKKTSPQPAPSPSRRSSATATPRRAATT
ncbi:hypothetical protein GCM10010440_67390 [Kitasatospora cinereorecta]